MPLPLDFSPGRRRLLRAAAAGSALAAPFALPLARAQAGGWPTRPITFIVPFPAGGGTAPSPDP